MKFNTWQNKKGYTLGAELEARIQDKNSLELRNQSSKLREKFSPEFKEKIHQEFLECMIEFVSPVCQTSFEVIQEIKHQILYLKNLIKDDDIIIATSGSHSYKIEPLLHVNEKRYDAFAREYGILLSRFHICGFHIHVALPSSVQAMRAYNFSLEFLPIFLALSANSPYFNGENARLLSYRAKIFEQLPRAGQSNYFENFTQMKTLYKKMYEAKSIEATKDIWWDVRISPEFGTLEIRVCDASHDFERLRLLIVLFQALCLFAQNQELSRIPHQILLQNRWNALRHGLDGIFQNNCVITTLREHFLNLVDKMEKNEIFLHLNTQEDIENLKDLACKDVLAVKQLNVYKRTKDFKEVEKLGIL
ncbi:MAG: YbdK family carboxylate-amine ligase [Epsilonproteobacteria bacterium]|nr:YbdK family carboxylate-amine ligase [Campylobacterota bacterium]